MPTMFGYSIGISDIRATFEDGLEEDCLRKIHGLTPNASVAFAGSVRIGFSMVYALRDRISEAEIADRAPASILEFLPYVARYEWAQHEESCQRKGCDLMLLTAEPPSGDFIFGQSSAHIFRAPKFEPEAMPIFKLSSIGSGSSVATFRSALEHSLSDRGEMDGLLKAESVGFGTMAAPLSLQITDLIKEHQPDGVSPHLHVALIFGNRTNVTPNDYRTFEKSGPVEFKMPPVVNTLSEFEKILARHGSAGADART